MIANNAQVNIGMFILTQTGTYQDQNLRPMNTTVSTDAVNYLQELGAQGQNFGIGAVQDVAGSVISPNTTTEGTVGIAYGWSCRRFRFIMKVMEKHPLQATGGVQRIFFGYTDNSDASFNYLDPDMKIYFNSELDFSIDYIDTPNGRVPRARPMGSNQIISPLDMSGVRESLAYGSAQSAAFLVRPEDVYNLSQTNQVRQKMLESGQFDQNIDFCLDTRAMVGNGSGYKYSRRSDVSPSRYLSRTLTGFQNAVREAELGAHEINFDTLYSDAQSFVANQQLTSNQFFNRLKNEANYMQKGYVTYGELCRIFPECAQNTHPALDNGQSIRRLSIAEDSNHWHGSDTPDIAAATFAQVVPGIMMDNLLRTISFAATNGSGPGQYAIDFNPDHIAGVADHLPLREYVAEFQRRLVTDVLETISRRNQIGFRMSMTTDLAGESIIDLSIDGSPTIRYVAPTFSDSLFSPMITHDLERSKKIANDLSFLANEVVPLRPSENSPLVSHAQPQPGVTQPQITPHNPHANTTQGSFRDLL